MHTSAWIILLRKTLLVQQAKLNLRVRLTSVIFLILMAVLQLHRRMFLFTLEIHTENFENEDEGIPCWQRTLNSLWEKKHLLINLR